MGTARAETRAALEASRAERRAAREATLTARLASTEVDVTAPENVENVATREEAADEASGPLLPFIGDAFAAVQLHQTSHSCIEQYFPRVKVGSAGQNGCSPYLIQPLLPAPGRTWCGNNPCRLFACGRSLDLGDCVFDELEAYSDARVGPI